MVYVHLTESRVCSSPSFLGSLPGDLTPDTDSDYLLSSRSDLPEMTRNFSHCGPPWHLGTMLVPWYDSETLWSPELGRASRSATGAEVLRDSDMTWFFSTNFVPKKRNDDGNQASAGKLGPGSKNTQLPNKQIHLSHTIIMI